MAGATFEGFVDASMNVRQTLRACSCRGSPNALLAQAEIESAKHLLDSLLAAAAASPACLEEERCRRALEVLGAWDGLCAAESVSLCCCCSGLLCFCAVVLLLDAGG